MFTLHIKYSQFLCNSLLFFPHQVAIVGAADDDEVVEEEEASADDGLDALRKRLQV